MKSGPMGQKSSTSGTGWLIVLAFVSILATFYLSGLLALSLDEHWGMSRPTKRTATARPR
ncbi:hypothetical protein [Agromyces aureus]|uniref:hypothetical protein n=1 Tax=Agromyces aureus TaxID=453304 RepID=UPI001374794B|nr:hypothetical protein [Agromyces aureus]